MRAAVYHGRRDLRLEDVPDAPAPGPGEVRVRVTRCGICGTDAHEYAHGPSLVPLHTVHPGSKHFGPTILGHEFTGVVDSVHDAAGPFEVGDRVVAGAGRWCGTCARCRAGRTNLCATYYTFGLQTHGGLAELVTVPERMCHRVPDELDDDQAVLAQPLAIAVHALDRGCVRTGEQVVVMGAGGIGRLVVVAAAARRSVVHVVDVDSARIDEAIELGASTGQLVGEAVRSPAGGAPDVVIEASGAPAALRAALDTVRPGGRVVMLGLPGAPVELAVRHAVIAEVNLLSSSAHVCDTDIPAALDVLTTRRIDHLVVERVVPLEQVVEEALDPMAAGALTGKAVITP